MNDDRALRWNRPSSKPLLQYRMEVSSNRNRMVYLALVQCLDRNLRLVEECFARRFEFLAERAILLTFPDLLRLIAHRQKVIRSN